MVKLLKRVINLRLIIGITGASGAILGITLLEQLQTLQVETHLVISQWGRYTIEAETKYTVKQVASLATCCYQPDDLAAPIASGSFIWHGMIISPCSMKTLSAIAHGYTDNLISRAADVTIKEKKPLIILPRETPLNPIHLENMLKLATLGVTIMPPIPTFYHHPKNLSDLILQLVGRVLDLLSLENNLVYRWTGHKTINAVKDKLPGQNK